MMKFLEFGRGTPLPVQTGIVSGEMVFSWVGVAGVVGVGIAVGVRVGDERVTRIVAVEVGINGVFVSPGMTYLVGVRSFVVVEYGVEVAGCNEQPVNTKTRRQPSNLYRISTPLSCRARGSKAPTFTENTASKLF